MNSPRTRSIGDVGRGAGDGAARRESAGTPEKKVLPQSVLDEIRALPERFPQPRSAVMPALDLAQEELGHLTPEAMTEVAGALQLDPGYVEGVATFYTLFQLQPVGEHRFYVCTNLSCMLRGAYDIVDHLKKQIGVKDSDSVSPDGLFSYEEVECLGACEYAPMMRLDHRYFYDLTPQTIDDLVAERRGGKAKAAEPKAAELAHVTPATGSASEPAQKPVKERRRTPRKKKEDAG